MTNYHRLRKKTQCNGDSDSEVWALNLPAAYHPSSCGWQLIDIPWKTYSSDADWDLDICNKVAFLEAWRTQSLYRLTSCTLIDHRTYSSDCVPWQRRQQEILPRAPENKPSPRRSTRWSPCSARSRPASCPASSGGLGRELLRHLDDKGDNQDEEEYE